MHCNIKMYFQSSYDDVFEVPVHRFHYYYNVKYWIRRSYGLFSSVKYLILKLLLLFCGCGCGVFVVTSLLLFFFQPDTKRNDTPIQKNANSPRTSILTVVYKFISTVWWPRTNNLMKLDSLVGEDENHSVPGGSVKAKFINWLLVHFSFIDSFIVRSRFIHSVIQLFSFFRLCFHSTILDSLSSRCRRKCRSNCCMNIGRKKPPKKNDPTLSTQVNYRFQVLLHMVDTRNGVHPWRTRIDSARYTCALCHYPPSPPPPVPVDLLSYASFLQRFAWDYPKRISRREFGCVAPTELSAGQELQPAGRRSLSCSGESDHVHPRPHSSNHTAWEVMITMMQHGLRRSVGGLYILCRVPRCAVLCCSK